MIYIVNVKTSSSSSNSTLRAEEFKMIEQQYRLTNASKGKDAVREAIEFVMQQKDQIEELRDRQRSKKDDFNVEPNLFCDKHLKNLCPYCNLTINSILDDGRFIYLTNHTVPPYTHKCWSLRVRYHTAPECEKEELKRNLAPIWKWKWTVKDAENKQCVLPPSFPPLAMDRYAKLNNIKKDASKPFVVFMMGLSFMGQPFQSLGCLYQDYVVGGISYYPIRLNITDIRANGGQCTGYKKSEIANYYPAALHPNVEIPTQNSDDCSMDSALIKFKYKNHREVHVCYTYIFNVGKNFPPGSKLPCDLSWNDIDIGISIMPKVEVFDYVKNTGGDVDKLSHLRIVMVQTIYEGMIEDQLNIAYKKHGFGFLERADYRAKFEKCGKDDSDIHYRLPGVTDYAVKLWFSFIATGLLSGYRTYGAIKYFGGKVCKSASDPNTEYEC